MSGELVSLSRFHNVTLYPNILPLLVEKIVEKSDLYLDINHDGKMDMVYEYVKKHHKPMLTFDNTYFSGIPEESYVEICDHDRPNEMVEKIKNFMEGNS